VLRSSSVFGSRAVPGHAAGVPTAARPGKRDLRRSAPKRARRDGRESRLFWSQWVYDAGHPRFVVTAATTPRLQADPHGEGKTRRIRQRPDSTVFRMPVTFRVGPRAGMSVRRVELRAPGADHRRLPRWPARPTMVVFADGNADPQERRRPADRVARHPAQAGSDLWNRQWAIEQLAQRGADTAAGSRRSPRPRPVSDYFRSARRRSRRFADYLRERRGARCRRAGAIPRHRCGAPPSRALGRSAAHAPPSSRDTFPQ